MKGTKVNWSSNLTLFNAVEQGDILHFYMKRDIKVLVVWD